MRNYDAMPHLKPQQCAVILVNYNNAGETLHCLRALHAMPDRPGWIVVVDNASKDQDRQALRNDWNILCHSLGLLKPDEGADGRVSPCSNIFLPLTENNGFGAGNNAAIRMLLDKTTSDDCRVFWILNNDTEPQPGALQALCDRLNDGAAMAGSTLVYACDGKTVQTAAGGRFYPATGMTRFILGGRTLEEVRVASVADVESKLDYIDGASLLCRRELCNRQGLFPEDYFLYYEDVDLGIATNRSGRKLGWARESIVRHKAGASIGGHDNKLIRTCPLWMDRLVIRNRYHLLRKYYPLCTPIALFALLIVLARRILRKEGNRLLTLCGAAVSGLLGRAGKPEWAA